MQVLTPKGPTTPYVSCDHGDFTYVGYTAVYNLLDYSAISFFAGIVAYKHIDKPSPEYKPLSEHCEAVHKSCKYNCRNT